PSRSRSRTAAPSSPLGSTGPADRSSGSRPWTARRSAGSGVVGDVVTGIAPSSGGSEAERPQPSQQLVLPPGCVLGAPRTERTGARLAAVAQVHDTVGARRPGRAVRPPADRWGGALHA